MRCIPRREEVKLQAPAAYIAALAAFDWQFEFADDARVWRAGRDALAALHVMQAQVDPNGSIWRAYMAERGITSGPCPRAGIFALDAAEQRRAERLPNLTPIDAAVAGADSMWGVVYWTQHYGIYRHDGAVCRPGLYRVIRSWPIVVQAFFGLFAIDHPHAVVDDFGNLVAVNVQAGSAA